MTFPGNDYEDDAALRELRPGYVARRRVELTALEAALKRDDFRQLRRVGHNLAGSGGAYGLEAISDLGRELETAAGDGNRAAVGEALRRLRLLLDELQA